MKATGYTEALVTNNWTVAAATPVVPDPVVPDPVVPDPVVPDPVVPDPVVPSGGAVSAAEAAATQAAAEPAAQAATPTVTKPDIGTAQVVYKMNKKTGKWVVVVGKKAAKDIPKDAMFTTVYSPVKGQSKNIKTANKKAKALAKNYGGISHKAIPGIKWRGQARIIANW
jgi:hypothetical protein